jgi:hypothetical protein
MTRSLLLAAGGLLLAPAAAPAQDMTGHGHHPHEASADHAGMADTASPAEGSGTARLPAAEGGMHGLHLMAGDWMLMAHGALWGVVTDQTGPRGDSEVYALSMLMLEAQRDTGWGRIQLRSMLSLEPLMKARGYPNLFATGETAGGAGLVDRQHPHDLFMELAARVDVNVAPGARLFVYGGPVGEPALGPSAFMHRASAANNPEPPITHHWFDSTHITYGVVTAGLATNHWQLEASAFRGREPDEHRWDIETPRLDSWSARLSWTPSPRWALSASHGRLNEPEALHPGENEHRTVLAAHYADGHGLSATVAFSAKNRNPGGTLTAWLAEANWDVTRRHSLFGRIENVRNDELFPDHDDPRHDIGYRVTKLQAGYAYHLPLAGPLALTLGGSVAGFVKPGALDSAYGRNPMNYTLFAKLSLGL